jgi:predicted secreted protein
MSTTNKLAGFKAKIFNGATNIASAQQISIKINGKTIDATDHDTGGWEDFLLGTMSWDANSEHVYIEGDASQNAALFDALVNQTLLTLNFYPQVGTGKQYYTGTAFVTSWELAAPSSDVTKIKASFKGAGALTRASQP